MDASPGPVDWSAAARVAARLTPPGPAAERAELVDLVAELRDAAHRAATLASRTTRLVPADGSDPADVSRVVVVDRAGWARANTQMLATMTAPLGDARAGSGRPDRRGRADRPPSPASRAAIGAQVGGVLALLAGKVLGQFDPFTTPGDGRLLLVAPNVLQVERALGVDPADFRLWVALHEQTHALQFAAAPWLAEHLATTTGALLGDLVADQGAATELVRALGAAMKGTGGGMLDLLDERQLAAFEEIGAVMALLEGHADVAMDAVGTRAVPSVRHIRARFESRRDAGARSRGPERVLRRLLGLDAKLAQYREGAAFVRAVRGRVGLGGLNAVWERRENLPTAAEIAQPRDWVRRVHDR